MDLLLGDLDRHARAEEQEELPAFAAQASAAEQQRLVGTLRRIEELFAERGPERPCRCAPRRRNSAPPPPGPSPAPTTTSRGQAARADTERERLDGAQPGSLVIHTLTTIITVLLVAL